jgi:Restriction endonuclease EcoRII, N-terminal
MILTKLLSPNDVGETGSHQAGMHIPKHGGFLRFFPSLDKSTKNPDSLMMFAGPDGTSWEFRFIYYNNRFFGGTRSEYRLTRMTGFLRHFGARSGDGIVLTRDSDGSYRIDLMRTASESSALAPAVTSAGDTTTIEWSRTIELVFEDNWQLVVNPREK